MVDVRIANKQIPLHIAFRVIRNFPSTSRQLLIRDNRFLNEISDKTRRLSNCMGRRICISGDSQGRKND